MSSDGPAPHSGAVTLDGLTKVFDRRRTSFHWRSGLPWSHDIPLEPLVALDRVTLDIQPGEAVGFVGPNGAGKSTLLKLIAGVIEPTEGRLEARGSIGSMIELGLGFHPELTGRENVWCGAAMLGLSRDQTRDGFDEIVAFSQLEDAIDTPLKHYSTGMVARLGFAVATQPAVGLLLIDEVLAVGDREFQERCFARIHDLVAAGTTLLFVSHEMPMVASICDRAVHLRDGVVVDDGSAAEVVERYLDPTPSHFRPVDDAPVRLLDLQVTSREVIPWQPITVRAEVEVAEHIVRPELGLELTLPTVHPDVVFAQSSSVVPALRTPGRYVVTGTSSPLPGEGGIVRVTATLVDGRRQVLLGRESLDLRIGGRQLSAKPHLAVDPTWDRRPSSSPMQATPSSGVDLDRPVEELAVRVTSASKVFHTGLNRGVAASVPGRHWEQGDFLAVDDVTIAVGHGESLGVIGPNGSGKSTLLKLIAGVMIPTRGRIEIAGRLVPVLDLAVGFDGDLSGHENLWLSARLLGLDEVELQQQLPTILEFSGIEEAMDAPVKQYSTGMKARLGLALALHSHADILMIDELLAVGDIEFRRQVADAVAERQREGLTVIFVSHDLRLVEELCQRVIRIQKGAVLDDGPAADVIDRYGGPAWAGGSMDAIAGIRIHRLKIDRRFVLPGDDVTISGFFEVIEPSDNARVELSYRAGLADPMQELSAAEREAHSFLVATVEPRGGVCAEPGWHEFTATVPDNVVTGEFDLVVSVIDEDENMVLTEAWQPLAVGRPRPDASVGPQFDVTWDVESG